MKKIQPYQSVSEALQSLDNGGRFFNLFAHEDDGKITDSELEKVAGLFGNKQKAILYLEMAISNLTSPDQDLIISKLDEHAQKTYQKYKAVKLSPAEAKTTAVKNRSMIITGTPVLINMKSGLTGVILVPVMVGSVMTMITVPITDQYDIYEIRDQGSDENFLIAHDKTKEKLEEQRMHVGGIVKLFHLDDDQKEEKLFLDIAFYV